MSSRQLVEFIILDIETLDLRGPSSFNHNGRWSLAECTVARLSDFGSNDKVYTARTHLGHLLHPGDHAIGYDVANANLTDSDLEVATHRGMHLPEVILVRKSYEERRRRRRAKGTQRGWKLKRMAVEYAADDEGAGNAGGRGGRGVSAAEMEAADMERFLEELEEDPEMRARVALYRDPEAIHARIQRGGEMDAGEETDGEEDGDVPEVPLEELLDDLAAMQLEEDVGDGYDDESGGGSGHHMVE